MSYQRSGGASQLLCKVYLFQQKFLIFFQCFKFLIILVSPVLLKFLSAVAWKSFISEGGGQGISLYLSIWNFYTDISQK